MFVFGARWFYGSEKVGMCGARILAAIVACDVENREVNEPDIDHDQKLPITIYSSRRNRLDVVACSLYWLAFWVRRVSYHSMPKKLLFARCTIVWSYQLLHRRSANIDFDEIRATRGFVLLLFVVVVAVRRDHLETGLVALVDVHEIDLSTQILNLVRAHCQFGDSYRGWGSFTMHSSWSFRKSTFNSQLSSYSGFR